MVGLSFVRWQNFFLKAHHQFLQKGVLTMTKQQRDLINEANERSSELEEAIVMAVAEIDQSDSSRVGLQETLDSVREILGNAYGDELTDDVNEFLGLETVDGEDLTEDDAETEVE